MNIDPKSPAGADFAARSLAHEAIKSQLSFERVKRVAQSQGKRVPSRLAVAVAQTRIAKAKDKTPDLVAVYDSTGTLLGVVPQDRMVDVPAGSAVYDANGKATGIVSTDGKLTLLADGPDAVAKVAKSIAAQGAAVAKRLQAHRVAKGLSPTPTRQRKPIDAVAWLTALGLRINAERVSKGMIPATSDTKPVPPLLTAAIIYAKSSPVQKAAINRVLAKATPASRQAARVALLNIEADTLGPRPTVPRR
jgi:hypothetical protein